MKKMLVIVYNEAIDVEVMEAMEKCGLKNYTKVMGAYGRGDASGVHLGNDIWPGRNNILYVACEEGAAQEFISSIKELKKRLDREGIKAFLLPIEDLV